MRTATPPFLWRRTFVPVKSFGLRVLAITALAATPLALVPLFPAPDTHAFDALRPSFTPSWSAALDALAWFVVWRASRGVLPSVWLRGLIWAPFAVATFGLLTGPLTLASLLLCQGLAARHSGNPARPYVQAGLAGGVLVGLGPLGAVVTLLTLCFVYLVTKGTTRRAQIRAETLIAAFVPLMVAGGLIFIGWTSSGAWGLTIRTLRSAETYLSASPWLAAFGGGAAVSWAILIAVALAAGSPALLALITAPTREPARIAAIFIAAGVLGAGMLTAANILADPFALIALVLAADAVALGALTSRTRTFAVVMAAAAGTLVALLSLSPLAAQTREARSHALLWRSTVNDSGPPAWGVAPSARARFKEFSDR